MSRIVITGLGSVNPLSEIKDGALVDKNVENVWSRVLKGDSGIREITEFDVIGRAGYCKIAGTVDEISADDLFSSSDKRRNGRFIHHAVRACDMALRDAKLITDTESRETILDEAQRKRVAVSVGSGIGGIDDVYQASVNLTKDERLNPFFIPACLINSASSIISMKFGFKGPNQSLVTACSSGAHSIIDGVRMLKDKTVDFAVVGGAEASVSPLALEGFAAMKALCAGYNDNPQAGSRPYDKARSGFVMGEGAAILVLEREEDAKARGAKIYAYVAGYGATADAYHITNPNPEGAADAMRLAFGMSGADLSEVGHINAHATSTPNGDVSELKAIKDVFGAQAHKVAISGTKSLTGHLLGAAGAIESIFAILALRDQKAPGTRNVENIDEEAFCNGEQMSISEKVQDLDCKYVISNSFGFGGTNTSIMFGKVDN